VGRVRRERGRVYGERAVAHRRRVALPSVKDWAAALDAYVAGDREEVVPPGWFTKIEIAKQWGKTPVYTNKVLTRMIKSGGAERKVFSIRIKICDRGSKVGHCRRVPHYRLLGKKS
jgi:hypothetical protein